VDAGGAAETEGAGGGGAALGALVDVVGAVDDPRQLASAEQSVMSSVTWRAEGPCIRIDLPRLRGTSPCTCPYRTTAWGELDVYLPAPDKYRQVQHESPQLQDEYRQVQDEYRQVRDESPQVQDESPQAQDESPQVQDESPQVQDEFGREDAKTARERRRPHPTSPEVASGRE
jgi:hypothetical protein